jgi:excisionase family DNA binding protein
LDFILRYPKRFARTDSEDFLMHHAAVEKLGLTIAEAAFAAGIGRSRLYEAIADGQLTARKFGARTVILRSDLNSFLDALPAIKGEAAVRRSA